MKRPPRLDTLASFQTAIRTPNGSGGFEVEWEEQFSEYVALKRDQGRVEVYAAAPRTAQPITVTLRDSERARQVDISWRIMVGEIELSITEWPRPAFNPRFLEIATERGP